MSDRAVCVICSSVEQDGGLCDAHKYDEQQHTAEKDVPPRVGDYVTVTGVLRTAEALFPDGHYRLTIDVSPTDQAFTPPAPGTPQNPVNGAAHPCPTPGYAGRHTAVGAGAISPPYVCHGCSTWFVIPPGATEVQP